MTLNTLYDLKHLFQPKNLYDLYVKKIIPPSSKMPSQYSQLHPKR
jgi:hypothetical protein